MPILPKGRNLRRIGWHDGWLTVQFASGSTYRYGPGVEREVAEKLLRVPFPDKLFTQIVKDTYDCKRIS